MRHVALTGATGYVGSIIAESLADDGTLTRLTRRPARAGDLAWSLDTPDAALTAKLAARGVTDLIHAAWDMTTSSRAHAEAVSVRGSSRLLQAARDAGVGRVIFISTISAFEAAKSVYGQTKFEVETMVLEAGGIVLRLGLVHGAAAGGMLGRIRASIQTSALVPMIGAGTGPQHLLAAARLQNAIGRALEGHLDACPSPITLAEAAPVRFRDLVRDIARAEGRRVHLLPVPWPLLYGGLVVAERLGLTPAVRSDSVLSFVNQNPTPDFAVASRYRV